MSAEERIFLGTSIELPIQLVNGAGVLAEGRRSIQNSIPFILGTEVGSILYQPDFGSRMHRAMFEPNDEVLENLLDMFIYEALEKWETRIKTVNIDYGFDEAQVNCNVAYRILASNEIDSFIYPFYRKLKY